MKRVLIIAYYYPPLADVGAKRTVRFVTHMNKYGWKPHVLTIKNPDRNYCIVGNETEPKGVKVTRALSLLNTTYSIGKLNGALYRIGKTIRILKPKHPLQEYFCIPDPLPGWLLMACWHGKRLLYKDRFDLIYASVKPLGAGIVARKLSRKTGIPFIVDARDPLSPKILAHREPRTFRERFLCKSENKIIRDCNKFVVTTKTTKDAYEKTYPNFNDKFRLVYNGFDYVSTSNTPNHNMEKFNIIYLGNYYHYDLEPAPFFRALRELMDEDKTVRDNVVFRYLGADEQWIQEVAERFELQNVVKPTGMKNRDEMMDYVRSSDLFFIRNPYATNIGAKLFEGLAVHIPILSTYTHPEIEFLIKKYAHSYTILQNESVEDLKKALKEHYYLNNRETLRPFNQTFLNDFSGQKLTGELCKIFNETFEQYHKRSNNL